MHWLACAFVYTGACKKAKRGCSCRQYYAPQGLHTGELLRFERSLNFCLTAPQACIVVLLC